MRVGKGAERDPKMNQDGEQTIKQMGVKKAETVDHEGLI